MTAVDDNRQVDMLANYESVWLKCQGYVQERELEPAITTLLQALDRSSGLRNVIVLLDADSDDAVSQPMAGALQMAQQHPQLAELLLCGPERILNALTRVLSDNTRCFSEKDALFAYLGQRAV